MRSAIVPTPLPAWSPPASEATGGDPVAGLGLYLHWPFCLAKCPYCDFNSHVATPPDEARWRRAFLRQLALVQAETAGRRIDSIFFGGGTPSLMSPALVAALVDAIAGAWPLAPDIEITLEANPTSTEAARLRGFRTAGVNRVSLGVQALDDRALAFLGRRHSVAEAVAALQLAARIMPRMSFDLIYARPGQTPADWEAELTAAIALAGEHLSLYQLGIETGTAFFHRGVAAADPDRAADLFDLTQDRLTAAGLPGYEISNHARPGGECRHHVAVWQGGDYLGLGPGAHGRRRCPARPGAEATAGIRDPAAWLTAVEAGGDGLAERTGLSAAERGEELLILGLRLADGIELRRFHAQAGLALTDLVDPARLAELADLGFLTVGALRLGATPAGRLRLDAVLARLLGG